MSKFHSDRVPKWGYAGPIWRSSDASPDRRRILRNWPSVFSDDVAGSVTSDETGLSAQAATMYFQRQGCAAKGAFRQQSADQPMTMAAAGTMVILIGAIHDVIAAHDRIESGFACGTVDGIGMHG